MSLDNQAEVEAEAEAEAPAPDSLMASVQVEEPAGDDADIPHLVEDEKPAKAERPEWLDEKFGTAQDLQKSYHELQKKFREGKHKAPEEYDMAVLTEANFTADDPVVSFYTDWAKKYNVNQQAFDELAGAITQIGGDNEAQIEIDIAKERAALGPNADAIINSNIQWADGWQRKGVFSEQERNKINSWGDDAIGQLLLQKIQNMNGSMAKIPLAPVAEDQMSEVDFQNYLQSKVGDPRWNADPSFRLPIEKEVIIREERKKRA